MPTPHSQTLRQMRSIDCARVAILVVEDNDASRRLVMETLRLSVRPDGMTVIDPAGRPVQVATRWKDLTAMRKSLVQTLTEKPA